jgi:hypothetical protein
MDNFASEKKVRQVWILCLKKGGLRTVSLLLVRKMSRQCSETGVTQDGGQLSARQHRAHSNFFHYLTTLYHLLNLRAMKSDAVGSLEHWTWRASKKTVASVKVQPSPSPTPTPTPTPAVKPSAKPEGCLSLRRTFQLRLSHVRYEATSSFDPWLKMLITLLRPLKQTLIVLGAFAKYRKVTINFVMSVCLPARPSIRMEQPGCQWTYFHKVWRFTVFQIPVEKSSFANMTSITSTLHEDHRSLLSISLNSS